jgi:hypothetical protein
MRRLILIPALLVIFACTFQVQTLPQTKAPTETPVLTPTSEANVSGNRQLLNGPDINYNGIRFTLDPTMGSQLYVFDDELDGATVHNTRFSPESEEYCQTWCLMVYPVPEFEKAFGEFVFPPAGYRGGAAVVFETQKKSLSLQNGSGDRGLETFGQDHYGVSNEALKYVFRGYTTDKQYAIFVQIPIQTASLPDIAPTMTTGGDPVQDILNYNQQAAQTLDTLRPADFIPNLDLLDTLIASIHVEMP